MSNEFWELLSEANEKSNDTAWKDKYRKTITKPVNPNATTSTSALLSKLYSIQGKTIISGQHEYLEDSKLFSNQIASKTGYEPMLKGMEFGGITGQDATTLANFRGWLTDACISWAKSKGGMLTATYHAPYPGSTNTWSNVQRKTTQAEFDQIVTVGSAMYNKLISDIDSVAVYLKKIQNADIPVLWRPYHEMNGDWFWWGKKSNYKKLWNIMYDRYTNYHKLNNLIWVWCPNAENQYAEDISKYYVGHDSTDVLALDIYNNDFKQSHHDKLLKVGGGKLIAIGENGELPNSDTIKSSQNKYSWFLTWGKMLTDNNKDNAIINTYKDSYVLKLGQQLDMVNKIANGDGLKGEYYSGVNFDKLSFTQIDPIINFNWGGGKVNNTLGPDNFSVKWMGYIVPLYNEEYTFACGSDDGIRLTINNQKIIERWKNGASSSSGKAVLEAGKKYPVLLEYYEGTGNASVSLQWSSKSQKTEIVPQNQLYSQ
ncbi:glycosyl hydrolase [Paenibacillus spiritus]|uniref:Glycosyl hydrolase n=1 Tax=Paenibacillus spiritus TaxID=2496557 RepID=A0A5J5GG84_9BACL|nr:glycosyl hydrolase [Paenibacillus spiritus]KAA9007216.1 glycosyl hydrolase [Paenibacillus spiritus]